MRSAFFFGHGDSKQGPERALLFRGIPGSFAFAQGTNPPSRPKRSILAVVFSPSPFRRSGWAGTGACPYLPDSVLQSAGMAKAARVATRIIGIDPGLNVTGYGVVEGRPGQVRLLEAGVIRLPRSEGDNLPRRLESLFDGLREVIDEFRPRTMCLEEVYSHTSYPRTSILMGHARGVICLAARLARVPVVNFSAKRIKQSVTGNGNASKTQVQRTVQQYFSLARLPNPPDVADALAVALCYLNSLRPGRDGLALTRRGR